MDRNRLGEETSPYLLQHKDNPVHWQAWGAATLAAAKAADKPILLSIGYAACHWCHVMAHESFENPAIAGLMNELFVNIKVDREERPDLDAIYQHALALMGEQGGWPLTMFLTPDGEPFWGGTYFPPEPRWGRPGFPQVLEAIAQRLSRRARQGREERRGVARGIARLGRPEAGGGDRARRCSTASPSGCCARSTRSMAASAPRRNFRNAASSSCCGAPGSARGQPPYRDAVLRTLDDDLPGRHLRPSRRRLCALFDRCALAGAAFREDALRQCRAGRAADPGLAGDRDPLYAQRVAETVGWLEREMLTPRRRLRQQPRCRQRARGRQILRLVRGRDRCRARGATPPFQGVLRRDAGRQLGRPQHPQPVRITRRWPMTRPRPSSRDAARCCCSARAAGAARARRQGAGRLERADDRRAGRSRAGVRAARNGSRSPRAPSISSARE